MNNDFATKDSVQESRFVEVLTFGGAATQIGYRLGGAQPGPNVLVAGHAPIADTIYDRVMALPTLPWMYGKLYLIVLDALDKGTIGDPLNFVPEEQIDEVLFLPFCRQSAFADDAAKQGYRTLLKTCARLGMINGRGVTRVS